MKRKIEQISKCSNEDVETGTKVTTPEKNKIPCHHPNGLRAQQVLTDNRQLSIRDLSVEHAELKNRYGIVLELLSNWDPTLRWSLRRDPAGKKVCQDLFDSPLLVSPTLTKRVAVAVLVRLSQQAKKSLLQHAIDFQLFSSKKDPGNYRVGINLRSLLTAILYYLSEKLNQYFPLPYPHLKWDVIKQTVTFVSGSKKYIQIKIDKGDNPFSEIDKINDFVTQFEKDTQIRLKEEDHKRACYTSVVNHEDFLKLFAVIQKRERPAHIPKLTELINARLLKWVKDDLDSEQVNDLCRYLNDNEKSYPQTLEQITTPALVSHLSDNVVSSNNTDSLGKRSF